MTLALYARRKGWPLTDVTVRLDGRDVLIIAALCLAYALVILPLFLRAKGYA